MPVGGAMPVRDTEQVLRDTDVSSARLRWMGGTSQAGGSMMAIWTIPFQIFLVFSVCLIIVVMVVEVAREEFWKQYQKGKWAVDLMHRGYLRKLL